MPGAKFGAWLVLLAITIVAAIGVIWLWRDQLQYGTSIRSTPSVVVAVRDLARLESVAYHVERVIDIRDKQSLLFGLIKTEDAILLVAVGEVTAGVDLRDLRDGDVVAEPGRGTARLSPP